jgi:hypothetical protein
LGAMLAWILAKMPSSRARAVKRATSSALHVLALGGWGKRE